MDNENFDQNEYGLSEQEEEKIIDIGIKQAKEIAIQKGLTVGQVVSNGEYTYELKEINGNEATVWLPGYDITIYTLPLKELFDPHVARRMSLIAAMSRRV